MASFNELRKMDVGDAFKTLFSRNKNGASETATDATPATPKGERETTDLTHADEQGYQRALPGVNILPESTIARRENRQLIRRFVAGGAAIAIVAVGCFGGSKALEYFHQQSLETIQKTNTNLTTQVNALTPYQNSQTTLDTARTAAGTALKNDVDVARLLTDLNTVAGQYGVTYTQINMALSTSSTTGTGTATPAAGTASACFNPDPFNAPTNIGCLTLSGTAANGARATAYFDQFKSETGFLNGFISGLTSDGSKATFNGTIAFDANFYSSKYSAYTTPLDQLIQQTTTSTASNAVVTTLKSRYSSVFASVDSTRLATLPNQVCLAATAKQSNVAFYQQLLATATQKQVNASDTTGIVGTIVNASCATAAANLPFLKTGTTTLPSSTPTNSATASAPATSTPATTSATPNVSSSSTAGTN